MPLQRIILPLVPEFVLSEIGTTLRLTRAGKPRRDIIRKYAMPSIFGIAMAASAYAVSLPLLLWMLPVVLGLLFAIPIAVWSPSARSEKSLLFASPEQIGPPQSWSVPINWRPRFQRRSAARSMR